jgi:thymidylate kinase
VNGKLIVVEGPDGVGKSTLIQSLGVILKQDHLPHEILSFPGDRPGTLGKLVYDLHHDPGSFDVQHISPIGLQAMHIAAHLDAITETVLPALRSGSWIVLDRFWWSTWVYGRAADADPAVLDSLIRAERLLWGQFIPSVVFLLQRTKPFAGNPANNDFDMLSKYYRELAGSEAANYQIVKLSDAEPSEASEIVWQWVVRLKAM